VHDLSYVGRRFVIDNKRSLYCENIARWPTMADYKYMGSAGIATLQLAREHWTLW